MYDKITKEINIKNSSDFLDKLRSNKLFFQLSRGEHRPYSKNIETGAYSIVSSACRDKYTKEFSYRDAMRNYAKAISCNLSDLQMKHFLAFCQHYGIPTNLLDFSTSPMVSLFFACCDRRGEIDTKKDGYVYFINRDAKDITSDITALSIIDHKPPVDLMWLFDEALVNNTLLKKNTTKAGCKSSRDLLVLEIERCTDDEIKSSITCEKLSKIKEKDQEALANLVDFFLYKRKQQCGERAQKIRDNFARLVENDSIYDLLYILFIHALIPKKFDFPMLFLYNPTNVIDRIVTQRSVFIYQIYNGDVERHQEIIPDFAIRVPKDKKEEIFNELDDSYGINLKSVYGDYDSIARHIERSMRKENYSHGRNQQLR